MQDGKLLHKELGIWKNRAKKDEKGPRIRLTAKTQFISFKVVKVIFLKFTKNPFKYIHAK